MIGKKIKRARITPVNYLDVLYFETELIEGEEITSKVQKNCHWDVHEDLRNAYAKLKFHLAMLCKIIQPGATREAPELAELLVTSFILGGEGEHAGVTIVGRRLLNGGRVLNLVSPFTPFYNEHDPYDYGADMEENVEGCLTEVHAYLNGKCAPMDKEQSRMTQGELFLGASEGPDEREFLDNDQDFLSDLEF